MNPVVIYTAAFGSDVKVYPQPNLKGVDFICFSDREHKVAGWKVVKVDEIFKNDSVRNNRYYKINPHLFLQGYDLSIYIDSNFLVLSSPLAEIYQRLQVCNMLVFDHSETLKDARNCIYQEHEAMVDLFEKKGILKDNMGIMQSQIDFIRKAGYPPNYGLIKGGVLIRRHNEPDVIKAMERWWYFIKNFSKRDQLSFNYVAWEQNLKFRYLPGDVRRGNPWFYMVSKNDKTYRVSLFKYRFHKLIKLIQAS